MIMLKFFLNRNRKYYTAVSNGWILKPKPCSKKMFLKLHSRHEGKKAKKQSSIHFVVQGYYISDKKKELLIHWILTITPHLHIQIFFFGKWTMRELEGGGRAKSSEIPRTSSTRHNSSWDLKQVVHVTVSEWLFCY